MLSDFPTSQGLYDPHHEKDACGIGVVADIRGRSSPRIVSQALTLLANMRHRGAQGYDPESGDGAGILLQIPHKFFVQALVSEHVALPSAGSYGVAMLFLPRLHPAAWLKAVTAVDVCCRQAGLKSLAWRHVPVDPKHRGQAAASTEPGIYQVFIGGRAERESTVAFERRLYLLRRRIEAKLPEAYVPSLSSQTIVYKGMLLPEKLGAYFPDLTDPLISSATALVHSRFSTNTFPSWRLAQPFRGLCHNGEINTLAGNLTWMTAREESLAASIFGDDTADLLPLVKRDQSDSACLDEAYDVLRQGGMTAQAALQALIPEAWEANTFMAPKQRAFHNFQALAMEPWDGPAAVGFSDGKTIGVTMDRNGLRPCRYLVTYDHLVVIASELGALPIEAGDIRMSGRLGPGQMLVVDTQAGRLCTDREVKADLANGRDFQGWLRRHVVDLDDSDGTQDDGAAPSSHAMRLAFGYTREEREFVLQPMAEGGKEAVSSMGDDLPLAIFSDRPRLLFDYFRQRFAQVTNPPIDPIREQLVMSTTLYLGARTLPGYDLQDGPLRLRIASPVLTESGLKTLQAGVGGGFRTGTLSLLFDVEAGADGFAAALVALVSAAESAVRGGAHALVLSDRGVDRQKAALPSLLAVAAVHHALLRAGLRQKASLVVDTGEARDVHQMACLIGYGAAAVCPYLAYGEIAKLGDPSTSRKKYRAALNDGLKKIMSKLGIATLASYCGAQAFEALGLGAALIQEHFTGTWTPIGGLTQTQVADETIARHQAAFASDAEPIGWSGQFHARVQGEGRGWTPTSITLLQQASRANDRDAYRAFAEEADAVHAAPRAIRHLLRLKPVGSTLSLSDVEPAAEIVKRFTTGAMSLGAIGKEAHETLALAMNRIGAQSNSGEGGEDAARYERLANGDSKRSSIKQVASGRFGVTTHYLVNAGEIQIKIAQGAKPGEGGQLPGHKVDQEIARLRHATPGVQLISPPPHHDIYSIEDLAQLIHDLKAVNPDARISVKLVAGQGVGAIAAGVAKAHAGKIVISGDGGGTGAAALSSIMHAGMPWEVGLAETHQTLKLNRLRGRVVIETDGQLRTGRDVVIAAALGADEFGFATAPLVATGCIMMRKCHLNTCPVGIATQDPELRARFTGMPHHVINYFFLLAEEVRGYLAMLGLTKLADLVGRTDALSVVPMVPTAKYAGIDLERLLHRPEVPAEPAFNPETSPSESLVRLSRLTQAAVTSRGPVLVGLPVTNADRAFGTNLAGIVAKRYGPLGLPPQTINVACRGYAGQSFGAFLMPGMQLSLMGFANDYVGKGLSGGVIAIRSPLRRAAASAPVLAGNTLLYGATSGSLFVGGAVGERFAVRNSGATAVVEGTGDHACEYMTAGTVVILGQTGRNVAAGMSGGVAYVYDEDGWFNLRCNLELVELERLADPGSDDALTLMSLLQQHVRLTESIKAAALLDSWQEQVRHFVKVTAKPAAGELKPGKVTRRQPFKARTGEVTSHA